LLTRLTFKSESAIADAQKVLVAAVEEDLVPLPTANYLSKKFSLGLQWDSNPEPQS
jgi:hypothetical protein